MSILQKIKDLIQCKTNSPRNGQKTGKQLIKKCQQICKQYPVFSESNYFTVHLPFILSPEGIIQVFDKKLPSYQILVKKFNVNKQRDIIKASIILNITQEQGILFMFVNFWVNYCKFQLNKIINNPESPQIQQIQKKVKTFFHQEFFLLCLFLVQLCYYLYSSLFSQLKQSESEKKQNHRDIFILIRDNVTSVRSFSQIHAIFRKEVRCIPNHFQQSDIQLNMKELDKLCKIKQIPAPFKQSQKILSQFAKMPQISLKLKKAVNLIQTIKQQMREYRQVNKMPLDYVFCADDVLAALTYIMWRLMKNIYGVCIYIQAVLFCEYDEFQDKYLCQQLDSFGVSVRHSFTTIKCVAEIGLLEEEKVYSMI